MPAVAALSYGARKGRALALITALFAAAPAHAATYTIQDLGTLGGTYGYAYGINDSGQTAGFATVTNDLAERAFRTTGTGQITITSLGTLGGSYSYAYGINDSGQTVGYAATNYDATEHAFRTAANGPINTFGTDLSTLGGSYSRAYGINTFGQTVGYAALPLDSAAHAFRTTATGLISTPGADLGTLGGTYSRASGINTSGQTVGYAATSGDLEEHAFRTTTTGLISTPGADLGTLGGTYSYANGINASGQTVGYATIAGNVVYHAFRTTATGLVSTAGADLGTLGGSYSYAYGINTSGQTVGESTLTGDLITHASFVDATGSMVDLNTVIYAGSGWELNSAGGINDAGQIVGNGVIGGLAHAFRLSKVTVATWVGGGADNSWSRPLNWNPNVAPLNNGTAALVFAGATRLTPTVGTTPWNVASIAFDNTAGPFTIGGSQVVTVGSGGIVNGDTDLQTITAPLTLSERQTFDAAAGPLSVSSVALGGRALTLTGAANITVGSVSGTGSVTKTGTGTLTLNGAQNYATLTTSGGITNLNGAFGGTLNANATTNITVSENLLALNIGTVPLAPLASSYSEPMAGVVPEPASAGLLGLGTLLLAARRRRNAQT